jgi:short-subunit dehydrogenase
MNGRSRFKVLKSGGVHMRKLFIGIGVGPGLGASTAERFAQEGFDILLTARNKNRVLELADAIGNKTGVKATALELDASNLKALAEFTEKHALPADVVHFNAAGMSSPVLQDTSVVFRERFAVNITSPLVTIKEFTSHLAKKGKGTILLTGGALAMYPSAGYLTLSIGKAGIRAMTEALFPQLAKRGIHIATVTVAKSVSPGSSDAKQVADEFWNLHSQPRDKWTWEFVAK